MGEKKRMPHVVKHFLQSKDAYPRKEIIPLGMGRNNKL